jgi:putative aldouronate transport system permease protein
MILMGSVSVWNLMVARTYIQSSIPSELYEAAMLDGASHFQYFFRIVLPLAKTIIAVLAVYYGVAKWNDYFVGLVYIRDRSLLPLQTILREILATLQVDKSSDYMMSMADNAASMQEAMRVANVAKYCIIVVATGPVVILYAFLQKYFEKGVMIGSLKG